MSTDPQPDTHGAIGSVQQLEVELLQGRAEPARVRAVLRAACSIVDGVDYVPPGAPRAEMPLGAPDLVSAPTARHLLDVAMQRQMGGGLLAGLTTFPPVSSAGGAMAVAALGGAALWMVARGTSLASKANARIAEGQRWRPQIAEVRARQRRDRLDRAIADAHPEMSPVDRTTVADRIVGIVGRQIDDARLVARVHPPRPSTTSFPDPLGPLAQGAFFAGGVAIGLLPLLVSSVQSSASADATPPPRSQTSSSSGPANHSSSRPALFGLQFHADGSITPAIGDERGQVVDRPSGEMVTMYDAGSPRSRTITTLNLGTGRPKGIVGIRVHEHGGDAHVGPTAFDLASLVDLDRAALVPVGPDGRVAGTHRNEALTL